MKAVLDANVLISGLLWTGKPNKLLKKIEDGRVELCSSNHLAKELHDVLCRNKFAAKLAERSITADQLMEIFEQYALFYPDIPIQPVIKEDPSDDKVLACAVSADADYIVTGDPHLLRLKSYHGILIITPDQALKRLV